MRGWKIAIYGKKYFDKWSVQKGQAMNQNLRERNETEMEGWHRWKPYDAFLNLTEQQLVLARFF
ncbi:hypothetical protein [Desulfonatronum sp. SC1]|uniref:hypothetical protein n=1 Tax=Desulfonatronum sp. SC1 TaxID=2109626 RepID=UPI0011B26AC3|nr:hypothetical protein [Desulfonatronum sp. SC1]